MSCLRGLWSLLYIFGIILALWSSFEDYIDIVYEITYTGALGWSSRIDFGEVFEAEKGFKLADWSAPALAYNLYDIYKTIL